MSQWKCTYKCGSVLFQYFPTFHVENLTFSLNRSHTSILQNKHHPITDTHKTFQSRNHLEHPTTKSVQLVRLKRRNISAPSDIQISRDWERCTFRPTYAKPLHMHIHTLEAAWPYEAHRWNATFPRAIFHRETFIALWWKRLRFSNIQDSSERLPHPEASKVFLPSGWNPSVILPDRVLLIL